MIAARHGRGWLLIAIVAMGLAVLVMLLPPVHVTGSGGWLAILPIFFVGVISPLTLFPAVEDRHTSRIPEAPPLPAAFQRPPPFRFA